MPVLAISSTVYVTARYIILPVLEFVFGADAKVISIVSSAEVYANGVFSEFLFAEEAIRRQPPERQITLALA